MLPKFYGKYPTPSYQKLLNNRLKYFNKQKKNIMNKEQTELEANKLLKLSTGAVNLLKRIGTNAIVGVDLAKQLLSELVNCGAVEDSVTYKEFMNNVALKKAMLQLIACSLSDRIEDSTLYGKGIVSHFDLFFNCNVNSKFNEFLASIKFDAKNNPAMVAELLRSRDNLYALIVRTRNLTIENMELMGTPDKKAENAKKKPAPILTKEDAVKKANEKVNKIANAVQGIESAKRKATEDDEEEEDEEDDEELPELPEVGTSVPPAEVSFNIAEAMAQVPKFNLTPESDPVLAKRQSDTLKWVVRVFPDVQSGAIGIGYFYDPTYNCGCIAPLPMEFQVIRDIYSRESGNVVFQGVRTQEEILGIPKKKASKGKKAVPASDTDSIA